MTALPKKFRKWPPAHLSSVRGPGLAALSLFRAVYMDDAEEAARILGANPGQLNSQDPFAALTPLHVAILRQNERNVRLLTGHAQCDPFIEDNFGRRAVDMLAYTTNGAIFEMVMTRAYPGDGAWWEASRPGPTLV